MAVFNDIELEIVRRGPAHNQLLSPLTSYIALCGRSRPVTFSIDLEQHELMDRISRLRYFETDGDSAQYITEPQRQAAVISMGAEIGKIFAKLRNLLHEQGRALGQSIALNSSNNTTDQVAHLRLVSSASEFANIPFEMAISPVATPAEGKKMLLDLNLPLVLTREIRRTRPIPISWDRKIDTKILIISAEPGRMTVPLKEHVRAIRKSLDPWIGYHPPAIDNQAETRIDKAQERIRILKNASIEKIYEICSKERFTHIHILAHGGEYQEAYEKRFGLILCDDKNPIKENRISGEELAQALQAKHKDGEWRSSPVMVTLATCDSGAQGTLLTPGGSLAYELHVAGIPWVIASQFPLSKKGSNVMTSELYPRIFRGDDPREVLFELRRILHTHLSNTHDWASLMVYASIPNNFDSQIARYFENQTKAAIETSLEHADNCMNVFIKPKSAHQDETAKIMASLKDSLSNVENYLRLWNSRLPLENDMPSRVRRAEYYGICGSSYKRIALLHKIQNNTDVKLNVDEIDGIEDNYKIYMGRALANYDRAFNEWATDESKFHWVATQYLFLKAVEDWDDNDQDIEVTEPKIARYLMAKELALYDLDNAQSGTLKAWACGTLAELALLSACYHTGRKPSYKSIRKEIKKYCQQLVENCSDDTFPIESTCRNFARYRDFWGSALNGNVGSMAKQAITILES